MNLRIVLIGIAAVASAALLAWLVYPGRGPAGRSAQRLGAAAIEPTPTPPPAQQIVLLFAGPDGRLHPELREVALPIEVHERARAVVRELLAGPTSNLRPVVPYPAEVNAVFVSAEGHAFVDLTGPPEPLQGSHVELMLAYGVIDSILLNCPELRAVQLLFDGREVPTLTGHLDLSRPLVLNKRFIASS
jgi:germination protein M